MCNSSMVNTYHLSEYFLAWSAKMVQGERSLLVTPFPLFAMIQRLKSIMQQH